MKSLVLKRVEDHEAFYTSQCDDYVCSRVKLLGRGNLLPDVVAVLAALFVADKLCDVALLIRMTLPHLLPPALASCDVHVSTDGAVTFPVRPLMNLKVVEDYSVSRNGECYFKLGEKIVEKMLFYLCQRNSEPCTELILVGVLPPKPMIDSAQYALALAAAANYFDVYEIVLGLLRCDPDVEQHAMHVLYGIATRIANFRLLKSLFREFPEMIRRLLPSNHSMQLERRSWRYNSRWKRSTNAIERICALGTTAYVTVLRTLFSQFPELRIGPVELHAVFANLRGDGKVNNVAASTSTPGQPDPLLKLVCEELPHSPPTLLQDYGHCALYEAANLMHGELRLSALRLNMAAGRVRYLVRHLNVKPDATTLLPVLMEDRDLFNELVTEHNALRNNHDDVEVVKAFWELFIHHSVDDELHAQLFPEGSRMPTLDVPSDSQMHMVFFVRIAVLLTRFPGRRARLLRMKQFVTIQLQGLLSDERVISNSH